MMKTVMMTLILLASTSLFAKDVIKLSCDGKIKNIPSKIELVEKADGDYLRVIKPQFVPIGAEPKPNPEFRMTTTLENSSFISAKNTFVAKKAEEVEYMIMASKDSKTGIATLDYYVKPLLAKGRTNRSVVKLFNCTF